MEIDNMQCDYRKEHPRVLISEAEMAQIIATGFVNDTSWHNDVCASFNTDPVRNGKKHLLSRLWVEAVRPEDRELSNAPRFIVEFYDCEADGAMDEYRTDMPQWTGDDLADVLGEFIDWRNARNVEYCLAYPNDDDIGVGDDAQICRRYHGRNESAMTLKQAFDLLDLARDAVADNGDAWQTRLAQLIADIDR